MKCPKCKAKAAVKETRRRWIDKAKRRRYVCDNGHRFTTIELPGRKEKLHTPP